MRSMIMRAMPSTPSLLWLSRIVTFVLAAVVAASAVAWGLRWGDSQPEQAPVAQAETATTLRTSDVARALGAATQAASTGAPVAAPVLESSRFALVGVVAGVSQAGAALIAVDGKPPKAFTVGAPVSDAWVLAAVRARQAVLTPAAAQGGGAEMVLDMPPAPPLLTLPKAP